MDKALLSPKDQDVIRQLKFREGGRQVPKIRESPFWKVAHDCKRVYTNQHVNIKQDLIGMSQSSSSKTCQNYQNRHTLLWKNFRFIAITLLIRKDSAQLRPKYLWMRSKNPSVLWSFSNFTLAAMLKCHDMPHFLLSQQAWTRYQSSFSTPFRGLGRPICMSKVPILSSRV